MVEAALQQARISSPLPPQSVFHDRVCRGRLTVDRAKDRRVVDGQDDEVVDALELRPAQLHRAVAVAGLVGFVGYGVSLALFVLALRQLGAARTGAYFSTAPFLGAVAAILFLREPLTLQLIAAGLLMGVGVWLHLTEHHEHEHDHEPMQHTHLHVHDEHHQHEHLPEDPPGEPHTHRHTHLPLRHSHPHFPDIHHRHGH